jgi:hypothetical protein
MFLPLSHSRPPLRLFAPLLSVNNSVSASTVGLAPPRPEPGPPNGPSFHHVSNFPRWRIRFFPPKAVFLSLVPTPPISPARGEDYNPLPNGDRCDTGTTRDISTARTQRGKAADQAGIAHGRGRGNCGVRKCSVPTCGATEAPLGGGGALLPACFWGIGARSHC